MTHELIQRATDVVEELSKKPSTTWGEVKAAILALNPDQPSVEAEETEAMIMLRRLHDAMGVALEFRRLSATPKERAEAKAAIQVWRDVELYLKGKPK